MNRRAVCLATLLLAGWGAPAFAERAQVTADLSPEFKGYKTYSWVFQTPPAAIDPNTYAAVKRSIATQLERRGYAEAADGGMAIAFTVGRRTRIKKTDWGAYGGDIYTRLGVRPVFEADEGTTVTDGTLAIDAYDAATKRPVWRATATKQLPARGANAALVDEVVSALIQELPAAR